MLGSVYMRGALPSKRERATLFGRGACCDHTRGSSFMWYGHIITIRKHQEDNKESCRVSAGMLVIVLRFFTRSADINVMRYGFLLVYVN